MNSAGGNGIVMTRAARRRTPFFKQLLRALLCGALAAGAAHAQQPAYPGKLNFGTSGAGSTTHLSSEILKSLAKIDMVHVPYKGQALALVGLISGQVDMGIMAVPSALAMILANKVRPLAVLSAQRVSSVPDVPTSREAGVNDFEVSVWFGILVPAGTPNTIISRLNGELAKALAAVDLREKFAVGGIEPITSTPEQFATFIRSETARYAKVIADANISID